MPACPPARIKRISREGRGVAPGPLSDQLGRWSGGPTGANAPIGPTRGGATSSPGGLAPPSPQGPKGVGRARPAQVGSSLADGRGTRPPLAYHPTRAGPGSTDPFRSDRSLRSLAREPREQIAPGSRQPTASPSLGCVRTRRLGLAGAACCYGSLRCDPDRGCALALAACPAPPSSTNMELYS